jgi:hypothetical protein
MSNQNPKNKWSWKDSEIVALMEQYGLDIPKPFNRKEAITAINDFEAKDAEEKIAGTEKQIEEEQKIDPNRKLITVMFHSVGEQDLPYVPVGINGAFFYFPKEKEIKVPKFILDVLKDAVEDRMYPENIDGKIVWKKRRVQRFPYSIIDF